MNALVTGYSSGIGKAIAELLKQNGYSIITLQSRLENVKEVEQEIKSILKTQEIDVLINVAGFGIFEPHEEISVKQLEKLIAVNLQAPILLSNLCLRSLKKTKGHIINVTSVEATKHSKFSAAYTATKSGLRDFSLSLFEEVRKFGVRITSINPDITNTNFFDDLRFGPSNKEQTYLLSQEIAKEVYNIVLMKGVVTDITIRPQFFGIEKKS
jgi:short-subunit dehydrogenase